MNTPDATRLPPTKTPLLDIPFVFESYRELTAQLGAVDGHAASLAIAARFFADQSRAQTDEQFLGLSLARTYKVSTRFIDLNNLPAHLNQLLIVGTTKHWGDFLTRFRREQEALGRPWRNRKDGEDQFTHAVDCLSGGRTTNIKRVGLERYELIQYYRLVRNAAAHELEKRARLNEEFSKVEHYRKLVRDEYGLDAPNPFPDTSFDDHMLYTRVVKYVATDLCRLAPPRSFGELHRVLTDRSIFPRNPVFIAKLRGNDNKMSKAIRTFLNSNYNYDADDQIIEELVIWINDIPNRKVRRRNGLGLLADHLTGSPLTTE